MKSPKVFISYSWSNSLHEQWVLSLATQLRESGVDVILDKWDLKEGHDAIAFMEKMVTDKDIKKVIIIADKIYAQKADGRAGGVGTEAQIISKEIYENQEQGKFVAVVTEKDETGKPFLPTYYKSRIYIDLSESEKFAERFDELLRWIFNKPLYVKPELGRRPSFLDDSETISLGVSAAHRRAVSAIKEDKTFAAGVIDEYLSIFSENLEKFRLGGIDDEIDEAVITNIEKFVPYRNELIQLFIVIAQYGPIEEHLHKLHRFFETLIDYFHPPKGVSKFHKWDFDNFKFIIHELFLYLVAVFLKYERFEQTNFFMTQKYYVPGNSDYGKDVMVSYIVFRNYLESIRYRNERKELKRLSLHADLLKQRSKSSGIDFHHLMQADFVLFMRSEIDGADFGKWFPVTLLYAGNFYGTFEIFARSISRKYFDRVKCILNISQPNDLSELMEIYRTNHQRLPRWQYETFSPSRLLGYDKLATEV